MKTPDPSRERPTIATLLVAFLTGLVTWGFDYIPDAVPDQVTGPGYVLVLAVLAIAVGKAAQGEWFKGLLEATAPWAHDTHTAAVSYALSLDPAEHPLYGEVADEQLRAVGIRDLDEARARLGLQ